MVDGRLWFGTPKGSEQAAQPPGRLDYINAIEQDKGAERSESPPWCCSG
jgi:hypothetical protein